MSTVISAALISVLGAGLIGMLFHYLRDLSARFSSLEMAVKGLDTKFTGELQAQGERLTGELQAQGERIAGDVKAQGERIDRVYDVLLVHGERLVRVEEAVKGQGERLARIEAKLDLDPPAEAA